MKNDEKRSCNSCGRRITIVPAECPRPMTKMKVQTTPKLQMTKVHLLEEQRSHVDPLDCNLDENHPSTGIHYVFGDVMKPQVKHEKNAISVHCVGKRLDALKDFSPRHDAD